LGRSRRRGEKEGEEEEGGGGGGRRRREEVYFTMFPSPRQACKLSSGRRRESPR